MDTAAEPWITALGAELWHLRQEFHDQLQAGQHVPVLVLHLGVTVRTDDALTIARGLTGVLGRPVIALPTYAGNATPLADAMRASGNYLGVTPLPDYRLAWQTILDAGFDIHGLVGHSGGAIALDGRAPDFASFMAKHPDRVAGPIGIVRSHLGPESRAIYEATGMKPKEIGIEDVVSRVLTPGSELVPSWVNSMPRTLLGVPFIGPIASAVGLGAQGLIKVPYVAIGPKTETHGIVNSYYDIADVFHSGVLATPAPAAPAVPGSPTIPGNGPQGTIGVDPGLNQASSYDIVITRSAVLDADNEAWPPAEPSGGGDGRSGSPPATTRSPLFPPGGGPPGGPPSGGGSSYDITVSNGTASGTATDPTTGGEQQSGEGGIDLGSPELRYLTTYPAEGAPAFVLGTGFTTPVPGGAPTGQIDPQLAWNALTTYLAIDDPGAYWCNLNPGEPDRVIDPRLAGSDFARITLTLDLELKKSLARLTSPATDSGRRFWDQVWPPGTEPDSEPISFRVWATPGPIKVWATTETLYVEQAELDVHLESDYLAGTGKDGAAHAPTPASNHAADVLRRLILPQLRSEVNTTATYAPLRSLLYARIAAEWILTNHHNDNGVFAAMIDAGPRAVPASIKPFSEQQVFDDYLASVNNGEYDITQSTNRREGDTIVTEQRRYFAGGVDLGDIKPEMVTDEQLTAAEPHLGPDLADALLAGGAIDHGHQWAGAVYLYPTEAPLPAPTGHPAGIAGGQKPASANRPAWRSPFLQVVVLSSIATMLLALLQRRRNRKIAYPQKVRLPKAFGLTDSLRRRLIRLPGRRWHP